MGIKITMVYKVLGYVNHMDVAYIGRSVQLAVQRTTRQLGISINILLTSLLFYKFFFKYNIIYRRHLTLS